MNYKETVMSKLETDRIIRETPYLPRGAEGYKTILAVVKEAQAKLTWDIAEKAGIKKVVDEIARLALVSDDTTLKSYVVGLLAQVRSKYPKPLPSEGEK